jgi:hypothetical protein
MIRLKPYQSDKYICSCGGELMFSGILWQGLHVCEKMTCAKCGKIRINSLPVNQSSIEQYIFFPDEGLITDKEGKVIADNWYSRKLKSISDPVDQNIEVDIDIIKKYDEVIILNTLDYIYGHSLLFLLNLQRIIKSGKHPGIIVLVQPMLRWLVPSEKVAEIWTVKLGFKDFNNFYPDLSLKINSQLNRFANVWLSQGHLIPTNENIDISLFTGIKPYDFRLEPSHPGITFIWREDPDRLWIRNIYLLKGLKKLGLGNLLIPFQYLRVLILFKALRKRLGDKFNYVVAGLGTSWKFPSYIRDQRVGQFTSGSERMLCRVYSESTIVIGIHGSGMLLPSAHAGMAISLMPSKRWGNFAEDIIYTENDVRLAAFQRRIVPLNLCISDLRDIVVDMITGREGFLKKFFHSDAI